MALTRISRRRPFSGLSLAIAIAAIGSESGATRASTLQPAAHALAAQPVSQRWVGREAEIEAHLKEARVTSLEDIGTGVTNPQRAHLDPPIPFESFVWKPIPPARRSGHWESYKSEIAAYELDKLLHMTMIPPAVERYVDGEAGAAIMWLSSVQSLKQSGGKMPPGVVWGPAIRRMQTFDNLIGNPDRNAGNILIGRAGELILIDHSRAFVDDARLPWRIQRVDARLWRRILALRREDLDASLGAWIDEGAIDAMVKRRERMQEEVEKLVAKNGRARVIVE